MVLTPTHQTTWGRDFYSKQLHPTPLHPLQQLPQTQAGGNHSEEDSRGLVGQEQKKLAEKNAALACCFIAACVNQLCLCTGCPHFPASHSFFPGERVMFVNKFICKSACKPSMEKLGESAHNCPPCNCNSSNTTVRKMLLQSHFH